MDDTLTSTVKIAVKSACEALADQRNINLNLHFHFPSHETVPGISSSASSTNFSDASTQHRQHGTAKYNSTNVDVVDQTAAEESFVNRSGYSAKDPVNHGERAGEFPLIEDHGKQFESVYGLPHSTGQLNGAENVVNTPEEGHGANTQEIRLPSITCMVGRCDMCLLNSKQADLKALHYLNLHIYGTECSCCKKRFHTVTSLNQHRHTYHPTLFPFECEFCGQMTTTRNVHDRHVEQHNRKHQCLECRQVFKTRDERQEHQQISHCYADISKYDNDKAEPEADEINYAHSRDSKSQDTEESGRTDFSSQPIKEGDEVGDGISTSIPVTAEHAPLSVMLDKRVDHVTGVASVTAVSEQKEQCESDNSPVEMIVSSQLAQGEIVGFQRAQDEIVGLQQAQDEMVGSQRAQDEMVKSQQAKKEVIISKQVQKKMVGSQQAQDEPVGLQQNEEEMVVSKRDKQQIVIPQQAQEVMVISQQAQEKMVVSQQAQEKMVGSQQAQSKVASDVEDRRNKHCTPEFSSRSPNSLRKLLTALDLTSIPSVSATAGGADTTCIASEPTDDVTSDNNSVQATTTGNEPLESSLVVARRLHNEHRRVKCAICPYVARNQLHLQTHRLQVHPAQFPFQCGLCDKALPQPSKSHHRRHEKRFKCLVCAAQFADVTEKQAHMLEMMTYENDVATVDKRLESAAVVTENLYDAVKTLRSIEIEICADEERDAAPSSASSMTQSAAATARPKVIDVSKKLRSKSTPRKRRRTTSDGDHVRRHEIQAEVQVHAGATSMEDDDVTCETHVSKSTNATPPSDTAKLGVGVMMASLPNDYTPDIAHVQFGIPQTLTPAEIDADTENEADVDKKKTSVAADKEGAEVVKKTEKDVNNEDTNQHSSSRDQCIEISSCSEFEASEVETGAVTTSSTNPSLHDITNRRLTRKRKHRQLLAVTQRQKLEAEKRHVSAIDDRVATGSGTSIQTTKRHTVDDRAAGGNTKTTKRHTVDDRVAGGNTTQIKSTKLRHTVDDRVAGGNTTQLKSTERHTVDDRVAGGNTTQIKSTKLRHTVDDRAAVGSTASFKATELHTVVVDGRTPAGNSTPIWHKFRCFICEQVFPSEIAFKHHLRRMHTHGIGK